MFLGVTLEGEAGVLICVVDHGDDSEARRRQAH